MRAASCLLALLLAGPSAAAELRIGNGNEPESLDPHRAEGVAALNIVRDLFEGLTARAPDGRIVAGAARGWEASADGRTWTFHLRPGLRWSNGDALEAADFVAGLRRSVDPRTASAFARMLAPVEGADAVIAGAAPAEALAASAPDPRTVRIRLARRTPYLLGLLAHPATFPIHRASLAQHAERFARAGTLVGNGAYRLEEWVVQSHVRLARNRHYWNDAATRIDTVWYHPTEDVNAELKRYRAGELDVTAQVPLAQVPWIRAHLGAELRVADYIGSYWYGFNVDRAPFRDNAALRAALVMALDRKLIVDKLMHGLGRPAYGWVPPGTAEHATQVPAWADWPAARRLAEARRLYAAAGYSEQRPAQIELRYNTHEDHRRIATVAAAMWKQHLGVRTRLVNEEFKVFIANRRARRVTEMFRAVWIGDYDDATSFLDILRPGHGQNDTGWHSARFEALLEQAAGEADPGARAQALAAAERQIQSEWPVVPVYWYVSKHLVRPRVRGWQDNLLDWHYSKDLWLEP